MKKSKRLIGIILAAVMLLTTVQAAFIVGAAQTNSIKVATISDIRYQAGAADKEGLMLSKSGAVLDAAIANVKKSNADVLLVTGDLTNTGNRASHEYVANKLKEVKAEGIPVFVIPGEHDVREGGAVTAISKADFEKIYKDLGYSESKQDFASASYVADLGNNFAVVMSDSVAADGKGQMTQWVVDQAKAEIDSGKTVFAASHHPIVTRGSVDRTFIDLLYTLAGVEIDLGGKKKIFTDDPVQAANKLGLVDRTSVPGAMGNALIDAGVKFLFSGHGGTLSVAGATTTNGGQLYDIMSGSLVNASASVRYTTLYRGVDKMKEQRAEFTTEMITSAQGVDNVEAAAHAALKKQMPKEVDYAVDKAEKVITYIIPAIKPNVQKLVRELDIAALVPSISGLMGVIGGEIQNVKNDLSKGYIGPLFDVIGNPQKLHNIIVDLRSALEHMDFNGQDLYGFLTDVFVTIQKGDGKAPASVEGIFQSIRDKDGALLAGMVRSFADNFNSASLVSLVNEVLDLRFSGKYVLSTLTINVQLRGILAGPYNVTSGVYTFSLDLWNMLDTSVVLPNGKKVSELIRPLVNDLILGAPNNASTKQTPQRFNDNLRKDADQIVNLLFEFNVGDMIGNDVFAQGQRGSLVAKTITLDELGANLQRLVPDNNVASIKSSDWEAVRDTLNAAGRFTPEQLATVNKVLVPADTANNIPAVTQLDKLRTLANADFYRAVAADFTNKVNALPPVGLLTLDNAKEVYALQNQYVQFYGEIKANISAQTVEKLNNALKKIGALENFDPQVDAVIKKIDAIKKPVTVESENEINLALDAYKALDVRQQKKVTNYQELADAQAALKLAKENAVVIKAVEDKIDAIGTVENNASSKVKIDLARSAYDNLDKALQPSVKNYQKLVDAEERYALLKANAADLEKAQPVIDMIDNIGKVTLNSKLRIEAAEKAYEQLTPSQRELVTNHDKLVEARHDYDVLVAAQLGDQQAAQNVSKMIEDIGTVTVKSGAAIEKAKAAYAELTPAQQKLVNNYEVLLNAEKTYNALVKTESDKAEAKKVVDEIAAIGPVTVEKQGKIEAAREHYNALTSDQKRYVDNLTVLTDAEALLSVLKNDFKFEDDATGVIVRADSGVVPADTVMTVRLHHSGDMYDKIMAKGYSAIHLYDITLAAGGKNVVPTKNIKISIPQFALNTEVFKVAPDGTLTPVNAALERGSFTFTSDNAGTFVVAQKKVYVDYAKLDEAISAFEGLKAEDYDEAAFAKVTVAYNAAVAEKNANYALTSANQRKIDAAAAALNDAMDTLVYLPLDTTALRTALYEAKMLDSSDFEDFSAAAQAIDAAEIFLAGSHDNRDQAKANELTKKLNDAVLALKYKGADFTLIEEALSRVPKDLQNYTDDSVAALKRAIDDAKKAQTTITRKDKDWKAQVAAKAKAIDDAIARLKLVGGADVDSQGLLTALTIADLYYPADYVDFSGVEAARINAEELLKTNLTAQQAQEAEYAIYDAINALNWA